MEEGEFSFVLLPIKIDGSYNEADPAQQTLTNPTASANEPATFNFLLKYIPEDTANPPYRDTDQNPVFYYLVYEKQGTAENVIYSDLQYVVKVTLSKDQSGDFTATSKYYQYDGSGPLPEGATNNLQQSTSLTTAKTDVPQI